MIVNFWYKKISSIHTITTYIFSGIINSECEVPKWFCRGKTILLEKPGDWEVSNTRSITCANNQYKWFTSVLLLKLTNHVKQYKLMQIDQRGAKEKCSGTFQNLLIDNTVLKDAQDNKEKPVLCFVGCQISLRCTESFMDKNNPIHTSITGQASRYNIENIRFLEYCTYNTDRNRKCFI